MSDSYKALLEDIDGIVGGLTQEDHEAINALTMGEREQDDEEVDAAISRMSAEAFAAYLEAKAPKAAKVKVARGPTVKSLRAALKLAGVPVPAKALKADLVKLLADAQAPKPKRTNSEKIEGFKARKQAQGEVPETKAERKARKAAKKARKQAKREAKAAKVARKASARTGAPCKRCKDPIPAEGEAGYHHKRAYCPDGVCAEERKAEAEVAQEDFLAKRKKFLDERTAKGDKRTTGTKLTMKDRPKGVKLDSNGYPKLCVMCGAFVPEDTKFAATCGEVCHKARKAGEDPLPAAQLRKARAAVKPVQVHPQGDGTDKNPGNKRGKGKKKGKSPVESLDVPVQETGALKKSKGKNKRGAKVSDVAEAERLLREKFSGSALKVALSYLHEHHGKVA